MNPNDEPNEPPNKRPRTTESLVFVIPSSVFQHLRPNPPDPPKPPNPPDPPKTTKTPLLDDDFTDDLCDKSDCDHADDPEDHVEDEKDRELATITEIHNIRDLIHLGKLFHCRRRSYYKNVDLEVLHHLRQPLMKLDRMIGLQSIKETLINQIVYFLSGLQSSNTDMMHTIIEGPPGSGKTEVGRILGEIYMTMGLLDKRIFRIVKRSDLIGKYLGHTAIKTQEAIDSCRGGVMFIDEAYALGDNEGRDSFSKECLDTLNQNLSDNKHRFLCIIAGYTDALDKNFFAFNEGLRRRFSFKYNIDKYTPEELRDIFLLKVREFGWNIAVDVGDFFKEHYDLFPHYGGDVETLFLNMRICHGRRIFCLNKDNIRRTLTKEDVDKGLEMFIQNRQKTSKKHTDYQSMFL
jgi:AAA+ superfamily predicted ATPase